MEAHEIVRQARQEGVELIAVGDRLYVAGPDTSLARWTPFLRTREAEVLDELVHGICDHCSTRGGPLLATYWTRFQESLCPSCLDFAMRLFDILGWPSVPWEYTSLNDIAWRGVRIW